MAVKARSFEEIVAGPRPPGRARSFAELAGAAAADVDADRTDVLFGPRRPPPLTGPRGEALGEILAGIDGGLSTVDLMGRPADPADRDYDRLGALFHLTGVPADVASVHAGDLAAAVLGQPLKASEALRQFEDYAEVQGNLEESLRVSGYGTMTARREANRLLLERLGADRTDPRAGLYRGPTVDQKLVAGFWRGTGLIEINRFLAAWPELSAAGAETEPLTAKQIYQQLGWLRTYVSSLGGRIGPADLRADLLAEAEEFPGFDAVMTPVLGDIGVTAVTWGILYPKLFQLMGFAGASIGKIPQVRAATDLIARSGGMEKVAAQYPRLLAAGEQALASFAQGAGAGGLLATAEQVGKDKSALEIAAEITTRAALAGGVAAVFSLAGSLDSKLYADRLRRELVALTHQRYDQRIGALPRGMADAGARNLIMQEKLELQQVDGVVADVEAELTALKAGKMYRTGQEGMESPLAAAQRLAREGWTGVPGQEYRKGPTALRTGLGRAPTGDAIALPTTRVGEVVEDVRAAVSALKPGARPVVVPAPAAGVKLPGLPPSIAAAQRLAAPGIAAAQPPGVSHGQKDVQGLVRQGGVGQEPRGALSEPGPGPAAAGAGGVVQAAGEKVVTPEKATIEAALRDLPLANLQAKAKAIGLAVRGKKAQLAALIAETIKAKAGTVKRQRAEREELKATEAAILSHGLYQDYLRSGGPGVEAARTAHGGIDEAVLAQALASDEWYLRMLAEKRQMLLAGRSAYDINAAVKKIAGQSQLQPGDYEDLLLGGGWIANPDDPHPGSMPFREFLDRLGRELAGPQSEWLDQWRLSGVVEPPRQMWRRLKDEWSAIRATQIAAELDLGQVADAGAALTPAQETELRRIDTEQVAAAAVANYRETLVGSLVTDILSDAEQLRSLRKALRDAYRAGAREGIAAARAAYAAQQAKISARTQLRERVAKLLRFIKRPIGKSVAFVQRKAIELIQAEIDFNFRARQTVAERQAAREYFAAHPEAAAPAKVLALIQRKAPGELTVAQLEEVARAVLELRRKGKILRQKERQAKEEQLGDEIGRVLRTIEGDTPLAPPPGPIVGRRPTSAWETIKGAYAYTLTPERLFDWLDGMQDFRGELFGLFWQRAADAEVAKLRWIEERRRAAEQALAERGLTLKDLAAPALVLDGVEISVEQAVGIYNFRRNLASRLAVTWGNGISESDQAAVVDYVENARPVLHDLANWILEHYEAHYARLRQAVIDAEDRDMGREENYTPMRRLEHDYTADERQIVRELMQREHLKRGYAEKGMTIQRKDIRPEYQKPIRLEAWSLLLEQLERQEHYIAFAEVTKHMRQIILDENVQRAIMAKHGRSIYEQARDYVDAVANPNIYRTFNQVERAVMLLRRHRTIAFLSWKLSTMLKQLPSLLLYLPDAGGHLFVAGFEAMADPVGIRKFVTERDPMVRYASLERELEELKSGKEKLGLDVMRAYEELVRVVGQEGLRGLYLMDAVARTIGWYGVYLHALDAGAAAGLPVPEAEAAAVNAARLSTSRTQPGAKSFQIPTLYRMNELLNLILQFTNQLNKLWNIATYDTRTGWKNGQYEKVALTFIALGLNALAMWAISKRRLPKGLKDIKEAMIEQTINLIPVAGRGIVARMQGYGESLPFSEDVRNVYFGVSGLAEGAAAGEFDEKALAQAYRGLAPLLGLPYNGPRDILRTVLTGEPVYLLGGKPVGGEAPKTKRARQAAARRKKR